MESAEKNVHDIAAWFNTTTLTQPNKSCKNKGNFFEEKAKNHVFDVTASTHWIIVATCNFSKKTGHISAACLKRKGTKGTRNCQIHKVDRDEHDDNTHSITSGDTASVHKLFHILRKKN